MSATSFTFGVLNIALTAFLLASGRSTSGFGRPASAVLITLSARHRMAQRPNKCTTCSISLVQNMFLHYGVLAALVCISCSSADLGDTFIAICAVCIFEVECDRAAQHYGYTHPSTQPASSCLSPPFLSWSFRWFPALVTRDWASRFGAALSQVSGSSTVTFGRMWSLGALAYVAWFIPYTAWLLAAGRKHSPARTGHDTVWAFSLRTNEAVRKVVGATDGADPDQPWLLCGTLCRAAGVAVMLCGAMPMWRNFVAHGMLRPALVAAV